MPATCGLAGVPFLFYYHESQRHLMSSPVLPLFSKRLAPFPISLRLKQKAPLGADKVQTDKGV
jgi:CRISPR/Cas system-associated protein Csm6